MFHLAREQINKKNRKTFLTLWLGTLLLLGLFPGRGQSQDATNVTTILNESVCKEFITFKFNSDSGESFTMAPNPFSLDDETITATASDSSWFNLAKGVCHSIQMGSKENVLALGSREGHFSFSVNGAGTTFSQVTIVGTFDEKSDGTVATSEDIFNSVKSYLQTSSSETGFVGYLKNSTFFLVIPKKLGTFNLGTLEGSVDCPASETISSDLIRRNCSFEEASPGEYFINQASYSVGTWMLVGLITLFFIFLLASDDEMNMNDEHLRENPMTLHPVYSIFKAGSEQFTKGSRYCQLTVAASLIYLVSTLVFYYSRDVAGFSFLGVLATSVISGLAVAWTMTYVTGFLLKRARDVDRRFLVEIQQEFSGTQLKSIREQHERDLFVRYYEYYTVCGILVLASVIGK